MGVMAVSAGPPAPCRALFPRWPPPSDEDVELLRASVARLLRGLAVPVCVPKRLPTLGLRELDVEPARLDLRLPDRLNTRGGSERDSAVHEEEKEECSEVS